MMDPQANLSEQLDLARSIVAAIDRIPDPGELNPDELVSHDETVADIREGIADMANRLAELVIALDEWRRKGGFDPYTGTNPLAEAPLDHIRALLDYNWQDEARDYEESIENGDISPDPLQRSLSGHVFERMQIIDKWLEEITE